MYFFSHEAINKKVTHSASSYLNLQLRLLSVTINSCSWYRYSLLLSACNNCKPQGTKNKTQLSWCCCSTTKPCGLGVRPPHLQEVVEVLEDADAHLVQVFEEAVEDGHQVGRRQLVAEDDRQLMDGEGQRAAHLPLEGKKRRSHKSDFKGGQMLHN